MRKLGLKVVKERKMRVMSTRDDVQLESLMFNLTRKPMDSLVYRSCMLCFYWLFML